MTQIEMELMFSRKMKDFILYDSFMEDCGEELGELGELVILLDAWRGGEFWPEMGELVSRLPDSEHVAIELLCVILSTGADRPIQGLAIELGKRLEYRDIIESAKIGSSILAVCKGYFYGISLEVDETIIKPRVVVDNGTIGVIKGLSYLPPNLVPAVWRGNYGGWQWEKKSILLGSGNHHDGYQCYDVLNKLQRIPWVLDLGVYVDEENSNEPCDFAEVAGHYVGERFYFTWRYDKRGRMYSSGYQLNLQSDEYGKALMSPFHGEYCTEVGLQALEDSVTALIADDKKILARKGAKALQRAYAGKSVAHFIELDATCSGYQMMACLSSCVKTGLLCNLTDGVDRQDLYMAVLGRVEDLVGEDMGYTRDDVKKAIMTAAYNSKAMPKDVFGDHVEVFWSVLRELLPGAMEVMDIINVCWNPHALVHSWIMPDDHVVRVPVVEPEELRIGIEELDGRRFTLRYNRNQPSSNGRSLVPNVIHSVDGYVAREMVRRCDFEISCIHDCFLFHPNHVEEVKAMYRKILSELARTNLLNNICSQIIGSDAGISIIDEGLGQKILSSKYALA